MRPEYITTKIFLDSGDITETQEHPIEYHEGKEIVR